MFIPKAAATSPEIQKQKLKGFLARWKDARFPMFASIFVDVIGPLRVLSLGLQGNDNDPVKALRRIKEFHWTMVKLQATTFGTANFDTFTENCKTIDEHGNQRSYQDVVLSHYSRALSGAAEQRREWVDAIVQCLGDRFTDLQEAPVYRHLCPILDTQSWPGGQDNLITHGDESIVQITIHFAKLLKQNDCDLSKDTMLAEWSSLKLLISETYSKAVPYQDVWAAIFSSPASKLQFSNILHIIELLLITPISNAVVERMFSTMARIKPQLRNRMSRDRLDSLLRIGEEGPSVKEYNPTAAIDLWYGQKKRRIGFGGHAYPKKRKKKSTSASDTVRPHAYFSDQECDSESE